MLQPRYIAFIVFVWIISSFFCALLQSVQLDASGRGEEAVLSELMSWREVDTSSTEGVYNLVTGTLGFFSALFKIITFQPAKDMLTGNWQWIYWFIFVPIICLVVYGLVMMFIGIVRRNI